MADFKRFYVTCTWDDWPEGGSYGTIIEAKDEAEALELTHLEMAEIRADEFQTAEEVLDAYSDEWHEVDCFDLDKFIEEHNHA